MNDELLEQISDLDSLAISNPVKYASEKHANRDWVLSADDVARVRPVNPDWFKEDRAGFFGKVGRGLSEAGSAMLDVPQEVKNLINSGGVALQDLVSPNMTESQMRTRLQTGFREMASIRANRQKQLELDELADSDIVNWSNMIGQVGLYALLGLGTGSAGVIGALSGAQAAGEINQSFMESYAEQSGDTTLQEYTPGIDPLIATSYGALAGWIESKLGVERLATGALARLAREGEFRALRQGLSSAVGEGAEESLQEFTGYIAGRMAGYDDRSETAAIKDALTAGLYGAILGGPTGAGLYYVNRARMINWFENRGLSHEQATTAANQVYDEAIADTMNEISANDSLRNYSGTEFNNLVDKVQSALVAAGWEQNNPGRSVADYARVVSADVANQVLRISGKSNLTTNEILNLGEIETDGNMVWLRPQNLQTVEQVQAKIDEIDERIKGINAELKQARADRAILQEDKEKSRQLRANLQEQRLKLAVLNRLLAKRRGDAVVERAELNRQKAELDRRAIQATNQDLANVIDSLRVAGADEDFVYVGNRRLPVNYRVVDMGQVRQSYIGGVVNKDYGIKELQNRASRGTSADDAVLRQRAQDFKPEFMVDSPNTQYGAPVVNKNGDVIAGNGRVETLRYVYQDNQAGADAYKQRLQSMGFDVADMERPILVREVADDLTTEQQIAIADASNVSEISAFDHASQAIQDSKLLQGTNGAIEWAQKLPITERQRLFLNNGKWDLRALNQRYNDALLAWMCNDDPRLFERIILSVKVSDKIISGLIQNGASIVSFQTAHPELDLRGDINSALVKASSLRNKNEFMEFVSTPDLSGVNEFPANSLLYNMVFSNTSGDINNFISAYMAKQETNTQGDNLLGGQVRFTKDDIYSQTLKQTYPDAWDGDTITNKNLLAVFMSQQNQYAGAEQPSQLMQEQFDLANENARLDDIYPAYTSDTINIDGVERTVYNSNGERIAKSEPALRNFWNWFGDSKVVDEQGRPLVMYHGSLAQFEIFKTVKSGIDFTPKKEFAINYAQEKSMANEADKQPILYSVYIKAENPFDPHKKEDLEKIKDYIKDKSISLFETKFNQEDIEPQLMGEIYDTKFLEEEKFNNTKIGEVVLDKDGINIGTAIKKTDQYIITQSLLLSNDFEPDIEETTKLIKDSLKDISFNKDGFAYVNIKVKGFIPSVRLTLKRNIGVKLNKVYKEKYATKSYDGNNWQILEYGKVGDKYLYEILQGLGFDGYYMQENRVKNIAVFEPSQIKSTENRGTFSADTGNIYYQQGIPDIDTAYEGETIEINGVERTVYNSNGDRIAKSAEALRNFWNWFGDSKVVDEQGRPLVVYHGRRSETPFDTFRQGIAFFTNNRDVAQVFSDEYAYNLVVDGQKIPLDYDTAEHLSRWLSGYDYGIDDVIRWHNFADLIKERGQESYEDARDSGEIQSGNLDTVDLFDANDIHFEIGSEPISVYLKIDNPKIVDAKGQEWLAGEFDDSDMIDLSGKYDGSIIKNIREGGPTATMRDLSDVPIADDYIVYSNTQIKSVDNRGTFSADTGNIYQQGRIQNGFYDAELNVIVLGRNFNTTTLPHEMSHFWLNTYFKLFKQAQKGQIQVSEQWLTEVKTLFNMLGINANQENLTRVQQERWAALNEGVITGYAGIPSDCALPITEYLNWIPEKYKSILQIGYLDENGNVQRPVLDKAGVDFFNEWYGNITLPSLPTSPAQEKITNLRNSQGEIIPSDAQTIKDRETTMDSAIREQKKADDELYKSVDESVPQPDKNAITAQVAKYYVPEQEQLPEHETWFKPGRRTNTVKEMERAADKYVKKNPDKAREIALSNPLTTENDSGVDRESLIRAVMKADKIEKGTDLYATYENNIALSRSRAGTELGLSSRRGSYQMYLDAYREMSIAMEKRAAYKYAGRGADSVDKLNTDILELVNRYADRIFGDEKLDMQTAIAEMCAEADVKFAGNEDSTVFNQLDLTNLRTVRTKRAFVAYAEHLIRKDIVKAEPDTTMQGRLLETAERAERAAIDVNSDDKVVAAAGMKVLREWTNLVRSEDVDSTAWSKFINSYAPRAMLSGISTHATNVFSGTFEQPMIRAAIGAYYGKNIVPDDVIRQESERIKFVYKNTLMNLTTMVSSQDPSLIHGEKYKPLDPDAKGWMKVYDAPMRALGAEDNLFRVPTYLDIAARMASRDSGGDVNKAIQLFKEYTRTQNKKVNGQENPYYAKRQEIINVAAMSVFTQNGKLAGALNKMRDALNNLTIFGRQIELGTAIAPFVKTPANIFASGMRAPFGAMRALYRKITGQPLDIQDAVDVAHSVGLLLIGLVAGLLMDYEPPYTGGKYDPNKPYDSIGIGGLWLKIDTLGVLETPLRLLLSTIHGELPKAVKGTVENIPLVGELVGANLDYLGNAPDRYISGLLYNQANKLIPTIARQVIKPIGHATVEDSVGLEDLDVLGWAGVETGIGRKIERSYGLDGGDLSFNDLVGVVWNRLKYYPN